MLLQRLNDDDNDDRVEMELIESYRYLTSIGVNPGCVQTATPTPR